MATIKKLKHKVNAFWKAKLPLEISSKFKELNSEDLKLHKFEVTTEKLLKIDLRLDERYKSIIIFFSTLLLLFLVLGFTKKITFSHPIAVLTILFFVIVISIASIKIFNTKEKKTLTLNRYSGNITFPITNSKIHNMPFEDLEAGYKIIGGSSPTLILIIRDCKNKKNGVSSPPSHLLDIYETLSFYVWYMDKNRPLPPGTAFDPYRQKDFERRKAEGFPSPLYRSHIPTPEATPEHQEEREKYWKDYVEEFTREPESELFDIKTHTNWITIKYINEDQTPIANTYFKFIFKDKRIVYMKTNKTGSGFEPPRSESFECVQIKF